MPYHDRMGDDMDCDSMVRDSTPELLYEMTQEKVFHVSKAADQQESTRPMGENSKATPTHASNEESVINVQLPYDPNAPMEWIVPPHFTPWVDRTNRIGHQKYQDNIGLHGEVHHQQTGK